MGKCMINLRIMNKPGKLTEDEFKEILNHVTAGSGLSLSDNAELPENSMITIRQHHEMMPVKDIQID